MIACPECGALRDGADVMAAHLAVAHRLEGRRRGNMAVRPFAPFATWERWRILEGNAIVAERRAELDNRG